MASKTRQLVTVGPFTGGLNLRSPLDEIRNNELLEALNVIIDIDGSVQPRSGWDEIDASESGRIPAVLSPRTAGFTQGDRLDVLGIIDDVVYVGVATYQTGTSANKWTTTQIYSCNLSVDKNAYRSSASWVDVEYIQSNNKYIVKLIKYNNDIYGITSTAGSAGFLKFTGGVFTSPTVITTPAQVDYAPVASYNEYPSFETINNHAFVFKDRLFIVAKDTIYFSAPTDFTLWTAPDGGFFKVDPSIDGNYITDLCVSDNTFIIFKPNSTYAFSYQADPNSDGYLRKISSEYGAFSAVVWRNRVFTVNSRSVYELVSGQFLDIGIKLSLLDNMRIPTPGAATMYRSIQVMGNLLVIGPYLLSNSPTASWARGKYFAYNLLNGAWTEWQVYDPAYHNSGCTDTYTPKFPGLTMYGTTDGILYVANAWDGRGLVVYNFLVNSSYLGDHIFDGKRAVGSTKNRLPFYKVMSKRFSMGRGAAHGKIYNILVDREYDITDVKNSSGSVIDADVITQQDGQTYFSGFFVAFEPTETSGSPYDRSKHNVRHLVARNTGGRFTNSQFRALQFTVGYQLIGIDQQDRQWEEARAFFRLFSFTIDSDSRSTMVSTLSLPPA